MHAVCGCGSVMCVCVCRAVCKGDKSYSWQECRNTEGYKTAAQWFINSQRDIAKGCERLKKTGVRCLYDVASGVPQRMWPHKKLETVCLV